MASICRVPGRTGTIPFRKLASTGCRLGPRVSRLLLDVGEAAGAGAGKRDQGAAQGLDLAVLGHLWADSQKNNYELVQKQSHPSESLPPLNLQFSPSSSQHPKGLPSPQQPCRITDETGAGLLRAPEPPILDGQNGGDRPPCQVLGRNEEGVHTWRRVALGTLSSSQ